MKHSYRNLKLFFQQYESCREFVLQQTDMSQSDLLDWSNRAFFRRLVERFIQTMYGSVSHIQLSRSKNHLFISVKSGSWLPWVLVRFLIQL